MYVDSDQEKRMEVMEDLSLRELLALKEIHLRGQARGNLAVSLPFLFPWRTSSQLRARFRFRYTQV
jgi:hypothetical protein